MAGLGSRKRVGAGEAAAAAAAVGAAAAAAAKLGRDRRLARTRARDRGLGLRADEPLPDGLRRIARGQVDEAREQLTEHSDGDLGGAIHEARKALKKARSVARLARDEIGDAAFRRENGGWRDAGRALSAVRDADVLLATLDDLAARYTDELPTDRLGELRRRLVALQLSATGALERRDTVSAVARDLTRSRERTATWAVAHQDFRAVEPGLRRVYRRGRRAFEKARDDPAPERMHAWRKRAKDLWYSARVLRDAAPTPLRKLTRDARALSKVLGEHHDLTALREQVLRQQDALEPGVRDALLAVVARRQDELAAEALRAGAELYAVKPRKLMRRIEQRWSHAVG
jgi:CHAD domain-containing protein